MITLIVLAFAFLVFMAMLRAVHWVDDQAFAEHGYRPFALPNVAFMLIPHGLLLAGGMGLGADPLAGGAHIWVGLGLVVATCCFLGWIVNSRTGPVTALFTTLALLFGASVIFFTVLVRSTAAGGVR